MKKQLFLIVAFVCSSCVVNKDNLKRPVSEIFEENPEILINTIKKHPLKVLQALNDAAKDAQKKMEEEREAAEQAKVEGHYENPLKPSISDDDAYKGSKNGPIILVEYSDFECPFCKRAYETVNKLLAKYKGQIKLIYKHLPLSFHPHAMIAAQYFEAAKYQGNAKAFALHDMIFENQESFRKSGEKALKKYARKLKLNMKKLKKDINSKRVKEKIERDIAEANKYQIRGTPGFILNGIPIKGAYPPEHFDSIIMRLKAKGKL